MSDNRSELERLWDNQRQDERHAAAEAADRARLVNAFSHNSAAVAALFGIDTTHFDVADRDFHDAVDLQPKLAELIEHSDSLDPGLRSRLARTVRTADLLADDPAAAFVAVAQRLRQEAIRRHRSAGYLEEMLRTNQPAMA